MSVRIQRYSALQHSLPGLPAVLSAVYQHRNITTPEQLNTELAGLLPYHSLKGITQASKILADAVIAQKKILIIGDFDADGATSVALMMRALTAMGAEDVGYLVPNRFEYGYGLTPEIVEVAHELRPELIITVDNGISSIDGVAAAKAYGIQVVVTDHHLAGEQLPAADAIVNPNQPGCEFPSKAACGCAVAFYVMCALRQQLNDQHWFADKLLPSMAEYLDLLALATIADVVPLDSNNRILVEQGLRRIRAGHCSAGISALLQIAGKPAHSLVGSDLGFAIGPRLNAAGRLDDMAAGIECLLCDDPQRALAMARQLDELNADRKLIEKDMQNQALAMLDNLPEQETDRWGVCIYQPDWHQGVIGILASRIKDKKHRPVIAFADANPDDPTSTDLKGSARSIKGLHIRDALDLVAKRNPQVLSRFGGHAMAAGLVIDKACFSEFQQLFDSVCRELMSEESLQQVIYSDGELQAQDFNLSLAQTLRYAGPWGQGFTEPVFDGEFEVINQRLVGGNHLKLTLKPGISGQLIDGICFNVDLDAWPDLSVTKAHLAFQLDVNEFRGQQSVQLLIRHIEKK